MISFSASERRCVTGLLLAEQARCEDHVAQCKRIGVETSPVIAAKLAQISALIGKLDATIL